MVNDKIKNIKVDISEWSKIQELREIYNCSEEEVLKRLFNMITLNPMLEKEFYFRLNEITLED